VCESIAQNLTCYQLIDALQIDIGSKLDELADWCSLNTCDSVVESLGQLFERSSWETIEKFFRLEKAVQDKVNCTNYFSVLIIYTWQSRSWTWAKALMNVRIYVIETDIFMRILKNKKYTSCHKPSMIES